jgi:hypothetical protein
MTFQVCVGAFKVIVPTTSAAVKLYDQFLATVPNDPVFVTTMGDEEVNVDRLRTELDGE